MLSDITKVQNFLTEKRHTQSFKRSKINIKAFHEKTNKQNFTAPEPIIKLLSD
jgi:hypothetical protein